jgi:hypothetical protein
MADTEKTTTSQERTLADGTNGASFVKDRYLEASKVVRRKTHEYWLNHAFLEGDQWLYWNTETRRLDNVPRDPERVQATIDRIGPSSRIIISKLLSRPLRFEVPPTGADDASLQAAYTSESIVSSTSEEHDWEQLRENLTWAVWKGGTAAIAVDWDPKAGKPVGVSQATGRNFGTGDTVETPLAITEFVTEPGARDGEKARWWIKVLALPPGEVQAMFDMEKKPSADATAGMSPTQARLMASALGNSGVENPELTLVYTYYERPFEGSEGKVITVVGSAVVEQTGWPFPWSDRLNLVILRESVVDGRWFGDTVLSKARPVQVAYNASWSSIIEHMKLAGNARLMVPNSSIDMIEELTDQPGEMVPYPDGTNKPEYLSPPVMPNWWIEMPDRLGAQLDDILGVHDVSRGVTPANVQSGVGISILSENDNTPTGRLIQDTARAFGLLATLVLRLYASKVQETRKAIVRVPGYPPETVQWSGEDLMDETRVIVPTEAIVPRSKAAMQQLAQKLMEMGIVKSFTQFAEIADLPDQHSMIEAVEPDVAKARRENHELALGRVVVPDDFDDDAKHIEQHNNFRKSPRYQLLDDEQKQICALHIQAHATQQAEKMANMEARMNMGPMMGATVQPTGVPSMMAPQETDTQGMSTPSGGSDVPPPPDAPPQV